MHVFPHYYYAALFACTQGEAIRTILLVAIGHSLKCDSHGGKVHVFSHY